MSSTNVTPGSTSPATPSPPSTSWQKPWVVAIVALSKSASACASRAAAQLDLLRGALGEQPHDLVAVGRRAGQRAGEPLLGADEPLAHAVAQLAGRHPRERDEQQLVERDPVGDVAGRQRGDRVRLAGARARLEHGHAGRQRAADVEGACSSLRLLLAAEHAAPQPLREPPEAGRLVGLEVLASRRGERAAARRRRGPRRTPAGARARRPPWGSSSRTPTPCARAPRRWRA